MKHEARDGECLRRQGDGVGRKETEQISQIDLSLKQIHLSLRQCFQSVALFWDKFRTFVKRI